MTPDEVRARIESGLSCSEIDVNEFSGGTDHYSVTIVSDDFVGLNSLKRHRKVMGLFKEELNTEEVHALALKTYTEQQWKEKQSWGIN